ncbi:MAG: outer membrane beta-barrel protein [Opitutaceae bacterium]|nr:outer membrane beta-barrel protein [Opitutaceae bacterium]
MRRQCHGRSLRHGEVQHRLRRRLQQHRLQAHGLQRPQDLHDPGHLLLRAQPQGRPQPGLPLPRHRQPARRGLQGLCLPRRLPWRIHPKVIGSLAVGFGSREFDSGGDESILDIDGAINFLVSEKTTFQVNVSNDFGDSAQGQQQKSFVLGGQVINKATDQWAVRAGLNYRKIDYYTRTDDYVEMTLGADYTVSANVTIQGSYAYRNYESDITGGGFTNNVFSLAANFRY